MFYLGIIFVLIAGVWILLWLVLAKKKVISTTQEFLLKTFVSTLAIMGTVMAGSIATTSQVNKLLLDFNANISNYQSQTVNVSLVGSMSQSSLETKLLQAEQAFDSGDYQLMMDIYSYDDTFDSAIRNNNYGYAYANGLYVEENLETAITYFDKAISSGLETAYANKFRALMCQQKLDEAAELIVSWSENSDHDILNAYFQKNIANTLDISLTHFCKLLSKDEQVAVLRNLLADDYLGTISTETSISDYQKGGYFYTYTYLSHSSRLVKDSSVAYDQYQTVTTYSYKMYKSSVVDDSSLNIFFTLDSQ